MAPVRPIVIALLALLFVDISPTACPAQASASPGQKLRFVPIKGKVRVEGTSSMDDWQVEARSIEGSLEAASEFLHAGQRSCLSAGAARVEVAIAVHALKSIEKDGKPFSNKMDDIMYESLKARDHDRIYYRLDHLVLKHIGKDQNAPNEYDARGQLTIAGVTNTFSMPVSVQMLSPNQLRIWGNGTVKMTDFQIDPPSPKIALGLIKTGDEIKLSFDWVWTRRE